LEGKLKILFDRFIIVSLLFWISFFPEPLQIKYGLWTKIILISITLFSLIKNRHNLFCSKKHLPLLILLALFLPSIFSAQNKLVAAETYSDIAVPLFSLYVLSEALFREEKNLFVLAKTICLFSVIVALWGILDILLGKNILYEYLMKNQYYCRYVAGTSLRRPISTQFNPVALGSYLLASLPFNFLLFKQNKGLFNLLGLLGMVLNTIIVILTFSRGVFLGLIALISFYLFNQKKYRLMGLFFIILFLSIFICTRLPYPFNRLGIDWLGTKNRGILSSYRFDRCIMTKRIIKEHPLVGLGFQHFRIKFYEYYPARDIVPYEVMIADNMYLTILAETGLIGFSGFLIFMLSFLRKFWQQLGILRDNAYRREQLLLILSAFVALLVNMGAYELFYWPNQYMFFCILIGSIGSFYKDRKIANNG
jgi:O-antigen ligase